MTKDDILGMVLKAGGSFCHQHSDSDRSIYMSLDEITRFVELVKQYEQEKSHEEMRQWFKRSMDYTMSLRNSQ